MLPRDVINKMDADELRNYIYRLQCYIRNLREINAARKAIEDSLIYLSRQREDLYLLSLNESKGIDRLTRLTDEIEQKYVVCNNAAVECDELENYG